MKHLVKDRLGRAVDFDIACMFMDDELREEAFMRVVDWRDDQEVFDTYSELHQARYHIDFII